MTIPQTKEGAVTLLMPQGRIDHEGARDLESAIAALPAGARILVDLSAVDYTNSIGLRVFLAAQKHRKGDGGMVAVCGLSESVAEVFRVSGMHRVLPVLGDRAAALASLASTPADPQPASGAASTVPGGAPGGAPGGTAQGSSSASGGGGGWAGMPGGRPGGRPGEAPAAALDQAPAPNADTAWRVVFWGTRGSLPVAPDAETIRAKVRAALEVARRELSWGAGLSVLSDLDGFMDRHLPFAVRAGYGGNTSCVQLSAPGEAEIVCDLGSGLRALGQAEAQRLRETGPKTYNIFVSHLHWDHIMGLPFFAPAFVPGTRLRFFGGHADLEQALRRQQERPSFPVDFSIFNADITFHTLTPGETVAIPDTAVSVTPFLQVHPGDSYGYRFHRAGRAFVYSTDSEHKLNDQPRIDAMVEAFTSADLVIFDAMYSLADALTMKEDWGHSSNVMAVDLCHLAGVGRLVLFHHEPIHDDATLDRILTETRRFEEINRGKARPLDVLMGHDGLVVTL